MLFLNFSTRPGKISAMRLGEYAMIVLVLMSPVLSLH